jgi:hypothetical protein
MTSVPFFGPFFSPFFGLIFGPFFGLIFGVIFGAIFGPLFLSNLGTNFGRLGRQFDIDFPKPTKPPKANPSFALGKAPSMAWHFSHNRHDRHSFQSHRDPPQLPENAFLGHFRGSVGLPHGRLRLEA